MTKNVAPRVLVLFLAAFLACPAPSWAHRLRLEEASPGASALRDKAAAEKRSSGLEEALLVEPPDRSAPIAWVPTPPEGRMGPAELRRLAPDIFRQDVPLSLRTVVPGKPPGTGGGELVIPRAWIPVLLQEGLLDLVERRDTPWELSPNHFNLLPAPGIEPARISDRIAQLIQTERTPQEQVRLVPKWERRIAGGEEIEDRTAVFSRSEPAPAVPSREDLERALERVLEPVAESARASLRVAIREELQALQEAPEFQQLEEERSRVFGSLLEQGIPLGLRILGPARLESAIPLLFQLAVALRLGMTPGLAWTDLSEAGLASLTETAGLLRRVGLGYQVERSFAEDRTQAEGFGAAQRITSEAPSAAQAEGAEASLQGRFSDRPKGTFNFEEESQPAGARSVIGDSGRLPPTQGELPEPFSSIPLASGISIRLRPRISLLAALDLSRKAEDLGSVQFSPELEKLLQRLSDQPRSAPQATHPIRFVTDTAGPAKFQAFRPLQLAIALHLRLGLPIETMGVSTTPELEEAVSEFPDRLSRDAIRLRTVTYGRGGAYPNHEEALDEAIRRLSDPRLPPFSEELIINRIDDSTIQWFLEAIQRLGVLLSPDLRREVETTLRSA